MNPTRLNLLDLAERRLNWLTRRQTLLAENIANADTPGWSPRDLPPFAANLAAAGSALARTEPGHLAGTQDVVLTGTEARPGARAPDGNAVALDEQLTKVADTETAQELVTSIYKKYMDMFSLALGRNAT